MEAEVEVKEPLWTKEYIMALVISFGVNITMQMLFSTIALYGKGLSGSDVFAGTLASVFTIAALCTRGVMAAMFRVFSLKQILMLGMGICLFSSLGYMVSDTQTLLVGARILHGIGFGIASTAAGTVVSSSLPKSRMLEGIGYSGLTGTIAMALGPSIALSVCNSDWTLFDRVFLVNLGLTVFVFVCAIFVRVKSAPLTRSPESGDKRGRNGGKLFTTVLVIFVVISFVICFLQSSVSALLSVCALERNMGNISLYFTVYAVASFISRLIVNPVVNKIGEKRVFQISLLVLMGCLFAIAFNHSPYVLFALAVPYGLASGMIGPLVNVKVLEQVTYEQQGSANAIYYASIDGGIGLGALLWSGIAGSVGYTMVYSFAAGMALLTFVAYCVLYAKFMTK